MLADGQARRGSLIVTLAAAGIAVHLVVRWVGVSSPAVADLPLYVVLALGGVGGIEAGGRR